MNHFKQIRAELEKRGLDAIMLTCESSRFYASDFRTMADEDGLAIVTLKRNYYITDSRYTEAAQAALEDCDLIIRENAASYVDHIKKIIAADGIKVFGFEDKTMTVSTYNEYTSGMPECTFTPASEVLSKLRESKDADEIDRMVKAQRIAEKALAQLLTELKVGQTEKEIAARLQYLMLAGGAERMSFDPIIASGENSSMPHAVPTDRKLQPGDFLTIDFGCIYHGYCSDTTRTVAIGYATEEMKQVYNIVLEAQLAGIKAAKAGVIGRDVHMAGHDVISAAGYGEYFGHGFGHSLGIEIHEAPNFNKRNDKPMPAGAVVSAEPGIYLPGKFGVRIEDVIILKADGCDDITLAPKDLMIIPV